VKQYRMPFSLFGVVTVRGRSVIIRFATQEPIEQRMLDALLVSSRDEGSKGGRRTVIANPGYGARQVTRAA